jgi:hypothetical protein
MHAFNCTYGAVANLRESLLDKEHQFLILDQMKASYVCSSSFSLSFFVRMNSHLIDIAVIDSTTRGIFLELVHPILLMDHIPLVVLTQRAWYEHLMLQAYIG